MIMTKTRYAATAATMADANIQAIKALKAVQSGQSNAADVLDDLKGFVGWGPIWEVFKENPEFASVRKTWQSRTYKELQKLLTPSEYRLARGATLNSHYTSPEVIRAIWQVVERLGFHGGNILEPSCGTFRFREFAPRFIDTTWTGVELDPIAAGISAAAYPDAHIYNTGFESVDLPEKFYDLAISNVPFGDYIPFCPRFSHLNLRIHNFMIANAMRLVRTGGLGVFITSTGTMDAKNNAFREYLSSHSSLVLAIRLPKSAFLNAARTTVTTDILFFRKEGHSGSSKNWCQVYDDPTFGLPLNSYYHYRPNHMLGDLITCEMYGGDRIALEGKPDQDIYADITSLAEGLSPCYEPSEKSLTSPKKQILTPELQGLPDRGWVFLGDGELWKRDGSYIVRDEKADTAKIAAFMQLYDTYMTLLSAQRSNDDDELVEDRRAELTQDYFKWVTAYGQLNNEKANKVMRSDPRYFMLMSSLEEPVGSGRRKKYVRAEIFTKRTAWPDSESDISGKLSVEDALILSLNRIGAMDADWMAGLLSQPKEAILAELAKTKRVYFDPALGDWVLSDEYLSGDVRTKLEKAIEAELSDNITALRQVLPRPVIPPAAPEIQAECAIRMDVPLHALSSEEQEKLFKNELLVNFGATWVSTEYYRDFIAHLMKIRDPDEIAKYIVVEYVPAPVSAWSVSVNYKIRNLQFSTEFGNEHYNLEELVSCGLNFKDPTVYVTLEDEKRVIEPKATEACRAILKNIKKEFDAWLFSDPERAIDLCLTYNYRFNRIRNRKFDGSWLNLPGKNPDIHMRSHQNNAIWRSLSTFGTGEGVLMAHEVGAGKTFACAALVMEARRLGLAKKPMVTVLKATVRQFAAQWKLLYPNAKLLVGSDDEVKRSGGIEGFLYRAAAGDWDAIIIAHSHFFAYSMSDEYALSYLETELSKIDELLNEAQDRDHDHSDASGSARDATVKAIEKQKKRVEARIDKLLDDKRKKASSLRFDTHVGVDLLVVDESQIGKNLRFPTKMSRVAGLPNTSSSRAEDLYMKVQYLLDRNKNVVFMTGTPLTNSLCEMFTLMRYMIPQKLRDIGLELFDEWASVFAESITEPEILPTGYKIKTRFKLFKNLPELVTLFRTFADVQTQRMLKLPRPEVENVSISVKPTDQQVQFLASLVARADAIQLRQVDPTEDNMLVVINDGRKSAFATQAVVPDADEEVETKVTTCAGIVNQIWNLTDELGIPGVQLIFSDASTPSKRNVQYKELSDENIEYWCSELNIDRLELRRRMTPEKEDEKPEFTISEDLWTAYLHIKSILIACGKDPSAIAFIHDATNDAKRAELLERTKNGEVRVLIGSTEKLGTGVNVQDWLIAIHHLDAPWRPADLEQRLGRMARQGNNFDRCWCFRYVSEGVAEAPGFDSFLWQTLETKQRMFWPLFQDEDLTMRSIEDIDEVSLDYSQLKAIASGDPIFVELTQLESDIAQLDIEYRNWNKRVSALEHQRRILVSRIDEYSDQRIPAIREDLERVNSDEFYAVSYEGRKRIDLDGLGETAKWLAVVRAESNHNRGNKAAINALPFGEICGFKATFYADYKGVNLKLSSTANPDYPYNLYLRWPGDKNEMMQILSDLPKYIAAELRDSEQRLKTDKESLKNQPSADVGEFPQLEELRQMRDRYDELDQQAIEIREEQERQRVESMKEKGEGELNILGKSEPAIYQQPSDKLIDWVLNLEIHEQVQAIRSYLEECFEIEYEDEEESELDDEPIFVGATVLDGAVPQSLF